MDEDDGGLPQEKSLLEQRKVCAQQTRFQILCSRKGGVQNDKFHNGGNLCLLTGIWQTTLSAWRKSEAIDNLT